MVDVSGQRKILIVTPLPRAGRDWSVLIAVPLTVYMIGVYRTFAVADRTGRKRAERITRREKLRLKL